MAASWIIWALSLLGIGLVYLFQPSAWVLALGAAALLLPILAAPCVLCLRRKLRISLEMPETAEKNSPAAILLRVETSSRLPAARIRLTLRAENLLTGERTAETHEFSAAGRRESCEKLDFTTPYCGTIRFAVSKLSILDVLRFWRLRLPCGDAQSCVVTPETFEPHLILPMADHSVSDSEQYSQTTPGYDYAEVFQVREYAEGDSPKQVHWKLSTKLDRLVVRDPSLPLNRWATLLWERGAAQETSAESDAMAEVLISVCRELIRHGIGCRVVWNEAGRDDCTEATLREEDDLYDALPKLLSAGKAEDSLPERYLRLHGAEKQGKVIVLTAQQSALLRELCREEDLTILLCGEGEAEGRVYPFRPENLRDALGELNLT